MSRKLWDTYGKELVAPGEVIAKASWLMTRNSKVIVRRLPFPKLTATLYGADGYQEDWSEWVEDEDNFPFDYNRQWEFRGGIQLRARYPHSWLLGQLKQVVDAETFADYESSKILEPVFEFDDESKVPGSSNFAYGRPSMYCLRHSWLIPTNAH